MNASSAPIPSPVSLRADKNPRGRNVIASFVRHVWLWVLIMAALVSLTPQANAVDGTWTNTAGGNWNVSGNWAGGIASGTSAIADFSTLNISGTITVNQNQSGLDVGNLLFSDTSGADGNWVLSGLPLNLKSSGTSLIQVVNRTATISSVVTETANKGFNKTGVGTLILTASNEISGAITISQGTLNIRNGAAMATGTPAHPHATLVTSGAALEMQGGITTTSDVSLTLNGTGVSGGGALRNVLGSNTYTAAITVATSSSIAAATGSVLNLTGGVIKNGTTLTLTGGGTINVNTVGISGAAANSDLIVDGVTVNLDVANTYNGPTVIRNSGTLNANVAGALPTAARTAVTFDGTGTSVLTLGAAQSAASLTSAGAATVTLNANTLTLGAASGTTTFAGSIGGTGNLVKDTAGSTQVLTGSNGYSGTTTISGGTLELGSTGSLTSTSNVAVNSGGTLLLSGTNQINDSANVTLAGGGKIQLATNSANEAVGILTLSSSSVIDFATLTGTNNLIFANSSGATWSGTLSVWNWTSGTDHLYFHTDSSGLTQAQLNSISFYSNGGTAFLGTGAFIGNGEVSVVPEPSAVLVGLSLLSMAGYRERRWFLRCREARRTGCVS